MSNKWLIIKNVDEAVIWDKIGSKPRETETENSVLMPIMSSLIY